MRQTRSSHAQQCCCYELVIRMDVAGQAAALHWQAQDDDAGAGGSAAS